MSDPQQLVGYDQVLLDRALAGDDARQILDTTLPWVSPNTKEAAILLGRLIELNAPSSIIDNARFRADPRAFIAEKLSCGEVPERRYLIELARRTDLPIKTANIWKQLRWVADAASRVIQEEHEYWPFVSGAPADPAVATIFAGVALDDSRGIHRVTVLDEVVIFFERLLQVAPPHIDEYRRWYRALHSDRFAISDEEQVPEDGALVWDYARFLSILQREVVRVVRFVRLCRRKKWALVIEVG
jgi:hypothetical protein